MTALRTGNTRETKRRWTDDPPARHLTGRRCRKVSDWQRDTWRFLYKNRLEQRHWNVLEQDRVAVENMEPDANQREHLYAP